MRAKTLWVTFGIIALAAVAIKMVEAHNTSSASSEATSQKPVAVVVVQREDLSRSIHLSAELRAFEETDLHAKVAGSLRKITVDIGDQVKKGQVIAILDIDELKDDLAHTRAAYHDAKLNYDRISAVIKKRPGLLAQEEVDKAQAAYEMAKATYEKAGTLYDYATIIAPFDGVITKRFADPGTMIQAGAQAAPIVHIADNTRLRLSFPVPESAVSQVAVGTPVKITVDSMGQTFSSKVARIAGKVDSATRTMETEVDLDNHNRSITPGMYASVTVSLEEKKDALALPVQAVLMGDNPNVWVVNAQHEVIERPVTLGLRTADKVEITGGLKEGEQVIFGSRNAVSIGMRVIPKPIKNEQGA